MNGNLKSICEISNSKLNIKFLIDLAENLERNLILEKHSSF